MIGGLGEKWRAHSVTSAKLRECYSEVELDDEERKGIALQTLQEIKDFFGRISVAVEGQGGVTLSYVCFHSHRYPLEDYTTTWSLTSALQALGERAAGR